MSKVGDRYGNLVVLRVLPGEGKLRCIFKCDCGAEYESRLDAVKSKKHQSCGCLGKESKKAFYADRFDASKFHLKRFGRWLVTGLQTDVTRKTHITRLVCLCDCGTQGVVRGSALLDGSSQSCGCLHSEILKNTIDVHIKHANARSNSRGVECTKIYSKWAEIRRCCKRGNARSNPRVCHEFDKRWANFELFLEDFGQINDDQTISRFDNMKPWSKENCYISLTQPPVAPQS
jgi:hypothetical protein